MKLKDKIAIVAGGGQGIGEGIVMCLAKEGADIAVVDINAETAAIVSDKVKSQGRRGLPVAADLTKEEQVNRAVKEAVDFFGRIDILVNSVGGTSPETAQMMKDYTASLKDKDQLPMHMQYFPLKSWDNYYEINLKTHVMLCNAVTPYFVKQLSGKIINISSVAGRQGDPTHMPYAAAKAGDISLTWSLAKALAPFNINVNCVCPGLVYTPLWERGANIYIENTRAMVRDIQARGEELPPLLQGFVEWDAVGIDPKDFWIKVIVVPTTPMAREQTSEDIGYAVVFLVSEQARNITGQVLNVDGGQVMR